MDNALIILSIAFVMLVCMMGWNSAEHRKDERTAKMMSMTFYALMILFFATVIKAVFV